VSKIFSEHRFFRGKRLMVEYLLRMLLKRISSESSIRVIRMLNLMYLSFQYAMFLLAFFLLEVAVGVFLYVNRGQAESITRKSLTTVFNDYSNKTDSRALVDEIQHDVSTHITLPNNNLRTAHCVAACCACAVRCINCFVFKRLSCTLR